MLTTENWNDTVNKMSNRMKKGSSGDEIGLERFENSITE